MTTVYLRHAKTGKRYKVVALDKTAGTITLKGENAEFTEPYDPPRFKKLGYTLEKDDPDAVE
jgi:hypothetical protein